MLTIGFLAPASFVLLLMILFFLYFTHPKRYYIIRHGQTVMNAQHIRQGEEGSLSEKGREQADRVGRYLKQFPVQTIVSSPYPRARETAEIINAYFNVPIEYSSLLGERRNPSQIIGRNREEPKVKQIVEQMELSYHDDNYRFSDEENFTDLKVRARKCVDLLAHQGASETIVVTHHVFLKIFLAYLLYRERLHGSDFTKLSFFNFSDNATVTICEYRPLHWFSPTRGWKILSFNEHIDS